MKKVLVTGANGHVGSNLALVLVEKGYDVRASVRDASDDRKTAHLKKAGIDDLVSLDVRNAEQFTRATEGIDTLFHVAATYKFYTAGKNADDEMVRDSLEGTKSAFSAAQKQGVKKIVMTSSVAAMPLSGSLDIKVDEESWREDVRLPYFRAKTEAERLAWKLAEEAKIPLVTILPGAIIGPGFLTRTTSTDFIEGIMLGAMRMGAPNGDIPLVDIRDVVAGHILAAEKDCTGRFLIINDQFPTWIELTQIMNKVDPKVPKAMWNIPDFAMPLGPFFDWVNNKTLGAPRVMTGELITALRGKWWSFTNARAKEKLGWTQAISLEQSLADTMTRIKELRAA